MSEAPDPDDPPDGEPHETLAEVLASIRALVSAETSARIEGAPTGDVILLTPDMRIDVPAGLRAGEVLADGLGAAAPRPASPAPILDEEALRGVVNTIVREELQGELGDRISRNLRKLIRREIAQIMDETRDADRAAQDGRHEA